MTQPPIAAPAGGLGPIKTIHYAVVDDAVFQPRKQTVGYGERQPAQSRPGWITPFFNRLNYLIVTDALGPWEATEVSEPDLEDAFEFLKRVMAYGVPDPWVGLLPGGGLQLNWNVADDGEIEAVFDRANGETLCLFTNGEVVTEYPIHEVSSLAEYFPANSMLLLPFFAAI